MKRDHTIFFHLSLFTYIFIKQILQHAQRTFKYIYIYVRVWIKLNNNKISREDRFFVMLLSEGPISNILKEKIIFRACECNTLATIKKNRTKKNEQKNKIKTMNALIAVPSDNSFFFIDSKDALKEQGNALSTTDTSRTNRIFSLTSL
jgi:hypothetical protein